MRGVPPGRLLTAAPKMLMLIPCIRVIVPPYFGLLETGGGAVVVPAGGAVVVTCPGAVVVGVVVSSVPQDVSTRAAAAVRLRTKNATLFPNWYPPCFSAARRDPHVYLDFVKQSRPS
jgi:hypothetical protein